MLLVRGLEGGWRADRVENVSESRKAAFFYSIVSAFLLFDHPRPDFSKDLKSVDELGEGDDKIGQ
jgi:hypothetical protein